MKYLLLVAIFISCNNNSNEPYVATKEDSLGEFESEAKLIASSQGISIKKAILGVIRKQASVGVNSYIDPDGRVCPDDGHHKILTILKAMQVYGINTKRIEIKVSIESENDFRNKSWEDFAQRMHDKGHHPLPQQAWQPLQPRLLRDGAHPDGGRTLGICPAVPERGTGAVSGRPVARTRVHGNMQLRLRLA